MLPGHFSKVNSQKQPDFPGKPNQDHYKHCEQASCHTWTFMSQLVFYSSIPHLHPINPKNILTFHTFSPPAMIPPLLVLDSTSQQSWVMTIDPLIAPVPTREFSIDLGANTPSQRKTCNRSLSGTTEVCCSEPKKHLGFRSMTFNQTLRETLMNGHQPRVLTRHSCCMTRFVFQYYFRFATSVLWVWTRLILSSPDILIFRLVCWLQ